MAECCDPIILPTCTHRCDKLVDACCVVDQQPLPCIFPPIETEGSGTIGQFVIVVDDPTGILVGMLADGDGIGAGAIVTAINGNQITLSVANSASFPSASTGDGLAFALINNTQCDINKAISDILCTIGCHTYTVATLVDPAMDLVWVGDPANLPEYSDIKNCKISLRGQATAVMPDPNVGIDSNLFVLPVGLRPARRQIISTVVSLDDGGGTTPLFLGAWLVVHTNGDVDIVFNNYNPLVPVLGNCTVCTPPDEITPATAVPYFPNAGIINATVTLDGISFDIQS